MDDGTVEPEDSPHFATKQNDYSSALRASLFFAAFRQPHLSPLALRGPELCSSLPLENDLVMIMCCFVPVYCFFSSLRGLANREPHPPCNPNAT